MNTINIFKNIDIYDITILALVLFIFVFLLIVTFSLLRKNKVLKKEIKSLKSDKEINLKNKEEKNISFEEEIPLNKDVILYSKKEEIKEVKESTKEEEIDEILEALPEIKETGPYKKNILRELSARGQTSPVNIGKSTVDVPKVKVTSYVKQEVVKKQFVKNKEDKKFDNETSKKLDEVDNKTFIEEITKRIESELKPQTIELTDYEKKQEEEAIISYQELLKAKDRIYKITDDEEIDTFIDELKDFRTNL